MMHEHTQQSESSAKPSSKHRAAAGSPARSLDWRSAHEELSRLAKTRAQLDWVEGGALLRALRSCAHLHLGFGSFAEYVERILGYGPRWTEERLRVAEALENLPEIGKSLRRGDLGWSAARELSRVATPRSEREWIEVARGRTIRQVEALVAGHKLGDLPADPADASLARHVLRFDVSAETLATFREAMAKLRRDASGSLDDDAALLLLARQVLGGPTDAGRASYQIALTTCDACGRSWQQGRGEQIEVGPEVSEMARCDAQHIGRRATTHVGASDATATRVCASDLNATDERKPTRAHQDVPPAVRREVMRRDGGRCVVPGCRHAVFVDIHHVVLRSEGGKHDADTLVVLCSAHHRALHRGKLTIDGRVSGGLMFRHADGSRYGATVNPHVADVHEQAFRALRGLGFREGEVRRTLERIRATTPVGEVSIGQLLREALGLLTATAQSRASALPMSH